MIAESGSSEPAVAKGGGGQGQTRDAQEILQTLGIEARDLSVPERMQGYRGVVITALSPTGLAAGKPLQCDLVMAINNSRISGANEFFLNLAASAAVQDTTLLVVRNGKILRVTVPAIPRRP